ncbi:Vps54-domain-containing protein [Marasmius fiardii PR-910]|nr:Vps54-domain-containing protein [Marasmius fiardii PR-910]
MSSTTASRPASPTATLPDPTTPNTVLPNGYNYRFNFGKGPESVSGTTDNNAPYVTAGNNPPLNLHLNLSASTSNLLLGSLPQEWSSNRDGFHAISTVLNNPHKRQAPPKAHSSLPSVPPADLPRVKRKDFDGYLRAIAPEHSKFESTRQQTQPTTSTSQVTGDDESDLRTPLLGPPTHVQSAPPLSSIPEIFFSPSFDLADPKTFAMVVESEEGDSDPTSLSHSLPLLEKLSHYLDTLEIHLSHEISLRSSSFFTALSNLQTLHSESTTCLSQITRLRGMLSEVDENVARRGLEVVRIEQKLRNVRTAEEGVKDLEEVVRVTGEARDSVSKGKWEEALEVVSVLESAWEDKVSVPPSRQASSSSLEAVKEDEEQTIQEKPKLNMTLPLSSFSAFSALPTHLRSLTMEIASHLSEELVSILRDDFNGFISTRKKKSKTESEAYKDVLSSKIAALIRTNGLKEATLSWREAVLGELGRSVVGKHFEEKETKQENEEVQQRQPSHTDFMTRLRHTYTDVLSAIEVLQTQSEVIREILECLKRLNPSLNVTTEVITTLAEDLHSLLTSFTSLSHTSLASEFTSPTNTVRLTELGLKEFVEMYKETHEFVVESEVRCKCMVVALRGGLGGVAKGWLNAFHQSRLNQQAKAVEDEVWNASEVGEDLQAVVKVIVDAAVKDGDLVNFKSSPPDAASETASSVSTPSPTPVPTTPTPASTTSKAAKPNKHLRIDTHSYHTVPCSSNLLVLLTEYMRLPPSIPLLTTDVMSRTMEFLKTFNSRVCQVVLGAGAMRSAGLKNITARHLALASQSLSIMIALIPYVREMFRRHLSQKQAVMLVEFDKLKRRSILSAFGYVSLFLGNDYQEHQNEIHAKLIAIMGDRLSAHIKSLQSVDWSTPPKPSPTSPGSVVVNDYMELLVKETVTLHKVLSRYLSSGVVEDVMSQVFAAINHRLSEEYGKIELPGEGAKVRLLADAKYLHSRLSALKNVGGLSNMLEIVVQEKRLPGAKVPSSPSFPMSPPPHSYPQSKSPPPAPPGTTSTATTSASQRLKGLLRSTSMSVQPQARKVSSSNSNSVSGTPEVEEPSMISTTAITTTPSTNGSETKVESVRSIGPGTLERTGSTGSGFKEYEAPPSPVPPPKDVAPQAQADRSGNVSTIAETEGENGTALTPPAPSKEKNTGRSSLSTSERLKGLLSGEGKKKDSSTVSGSPPAGGSLQPTLLSERDGQAEREEVGAVSGFREHEASTSPLPPLPSEGEEDVNGEERN